MGIRTITIKVCDRCGAEDAGESRKNEWGETTVAWKGHTGGRAWDGAAGGCNHEGKAWLCLSCTKAFLAFMKGAALEPSIYPNTPVGFDVWHGATLDAAIAASKGEAP